MKNIIQNNLQVITLSGVASVGSKNCYAVQYKDEIVMLDCGIGFPHKDVGINSLIPDVTWLIKNKKKIKAIILSHAHADHVSALPYVWKQLGSPLIISSLFTIEFIKKLFEKHKLLTNLKTKVIGRNNDFRLTKNLNLRFFGLTHGVPQAMGTVIVTPEGSIAYTGDFKLDPNPVRDNKTSFQRIRELAKGGITLELIESTNIFLEGSAPREEKVVQTLDPLIKNSAGRIIVGAFSSSLNRVYTLMRLAKKYKRKVAVLGRSLRDNVEIAQSIGYLPAERGLVIEPKDVKRYPDNQILMLATGSQAEELAALNRLSTDSYRDVKLKKGDTVLLASSMIPSRINDIEALHDRLIAKGVKLFSKKESAIHASGHGYQEDLLKMTELLQPKFVLPIHGARSYREHHKKLLIKGGYDPKHIIIADEGDRYAVSEQSIYKIGQIKLKARYIVDDRLLPENDNLVANRITMSQAGVLFVSISDRGQINLCLVGVTASDKISAMCNRLMRQIKSYFRQLGGQQEYKENKQRFCKDLTKKIENGWSRRALNKPLVVVNPDRQNQK